MEQLKERERMEVDQDQIAILQSYVAQHHIAPAEVLRNAIEPISPARPISRHSGRDYSSFGSIKHLPDGLEYQNAACEEW